MAQISLLVPLHSFPSTFGESPYPFAPAYTAGEITQTGNASALDIHPELVENIQEGRVCPIRCEEDAVPTYVYRAKRGGCKICRDSFEQKQSMSEAPLEKCTSCGAPVERVICVPFVKTGPSEKAVLSDSNLKKHGFSKLINEGDGKFRRT